MTKKNLLTMFDAVLKPIKSYASPLLVASAILLTACDNKWTIMPDDELAQKSSECMSETDPSTARIQVCKNIERECARRRTQNNYTC